MRSIGGGARWPRTPELEDKYIDLRVALEAIYLKDFMNEHSQEMRFRLALFGAWHLGADFEERRSIRKGLRDAYDTASKAVHEGELPQRNLSTTLRHCRLRFTEQSLLFWMSRVG